MSSNDEAVPPATTMRRGARRATMMNAAIPTSSSMTAAIESDSDAAGGAAQSPGAGGQAQIGGAADFGQAQMPQLPARQLTGTAATAGQSSNAGAQSASQSAIANKPVRNSQVCTDCRRRKIKCVRTEGTDKCENCVKRDIDCIFATAAPKKFTASHATMARGSRATAAKKAGRKAGKKVAGKRVAQKKGKGRAQAKAPQAQEHEEEDGGGGDESHDSDASVDDAAVAAAVDETVAVGRNPFHPIVAGGLTLTEAEMAKVASNPAVVAAAKTPAPSDIAYQMDMSRDPAPFQQEHNLGEPSYVGSLDDSLGGPLLNTAGELLDQWERERGFAAGDDDDYPSDYVADYDPTLGPEPDYFLLGLPVPARDQYGEPIIDTPAAAQPAAAAAATRQEEPEVEILGGPAQPAAQPPTFGQQQQHQQHQQQSQGAAPAATRGPANFGDITTYAMRPAPASFIEVHEREKQRHRELDRAEAAAKAKRNSGQSSSQQAAASLAPVVAPRGPTNLTTNMGPPPPPPPPPPPAPAPINTMVQSSLAPGHQHQHEHGPIFAEGTVPHQYSANKLLYLIEKQRADMMQAAMGGVSQLQAGRVEAARAAALEKWDEVNEGQDPAAYYDKEGREYLLRK
ncbi:hypothetical protein SLS53_008152 [Cytospora paraplurivora]|uniref:Zn(2)-C6 fungal-type domain-containing protein n=1 Tax=Cytospora paraplurivora TaxID=2898453 RepID=A0AAN9U1V0_9PEZI